MGARVSAVIVCDDVRKEVNGKDILIGVYSGTINVSSYPYTFPAAFWIEIEPDQSGELKCKIEIASPSGNAPIAVEFDLEVIEKDTAVFVMAGVPIRLERDGEIVVSAKLDEGELIPVKRKRVRRVAPRPQTS